MATSDAMRANPEGFHALLLALCGLGDSPKKTSTDTVEFLKKIFGQNFREALHTGYHLRGRIRTSLETVQAKDANFGILQDVIEDAKLLKSGDSSH
ncbi:hypothetical protein Btru_048216 [Bulinus truncatus]|nr:hypothetical protein Btru_048216 [Bulinus truncatus]